MRGLAVINLEGIAQCLIKDSLAPSSRQAYDCAQAAYTRFCSMLGTPCYPASEDVLVLYVADLSQRICDSTIRSYLSAIRHAHLVQGFQDPMAGKTRLELALKGSRRQWPRAKDPRLPITPRILKAIGQALMRNRNQYEQLLIWAACCLGFFGFLRSGEFTLPTGTTFNPNLHLTPRDIQVDDIQNPTMLKIHFKVIKDRSSKKRSGSIHWTN